VEIPKGASEEEIAKDNTAKEKGAEVENASWWSLGGSSGQADAKAGFAQGETKGNNASAAQKETKEDTEELRTESSMEAPEETPKEAPEEETTKDNTAEEKGAEVYNAFWCSMQVSPAHEDAKAESAQGEKEGSNESVAPKGDNEGSKQVATQKETKEDKEEGMESPSLTAWVASMHTNTTAFKTAWSAGLTGVGVVSLVVGAVRLCSGCGWHKGHGPHQWMNFLGKQIMNLFNGQVMIRLRQE